MSGMAQTRGTTMNTDSFSDEQMLNLVNNTITSKTEFQPHDFTGGSVILTTTHSNTVKKFKISLYFGYNGKHSVNRQIDISKDLYYIWAKAILVKIYSMDAIKTGMDLNELNKLMKSNSNSNSSIVDSMGIEVTPVPTPVPTPVLKTDTEIQAEQISDFLLFKIKSVKPNYREPNMTIWAKDIDKALRIDKRTAQELNGCIRWIYEAKEGAFWIPNIMSGKKLREKFDTIEMQMMKPQGETQGEMLNSFIEEMENEQH